MNGIYSGIGELRDLIQDVIFRGSFLAGKRHGFGMEYWPNGSLKYTGEYNQDNRHGYGTEFDKHGFKLSEGIWKDNNFVG